MGKVHKGATEVPSRKRTTLTNLARDYATMVLLAIQGIVLVPIYLHSIEPRLYGAWLATGSIVAMLGMLDFGFSSVIVQATATIAGSRDKSQLGTLIGTSVVVTLVLSLVPILTAAIIHARVPIWINVIGPDAKEISKAFVIAGATTSLMLVSYGVGAVFLGVQRVGILSIQFICAFAVGIASTLLFLSLRWGIVSIPYGLLVQAMLLSGGHGAYLVLWIRKNLPVGSVRFRRAMFLELFHKSTWVFIGRLSATATTQSDNLVVAAMIDPRLTIVLALTRKAADIVSTLASRVSSAFMSSLAHLSGGEEADAARARRFMLTILKVSALAAIVGMGGVFLLNELFVRLWVGSQFYGGALLTGVLCLSGVLLILNTCLYNNIFSTGQVRVSSVATVCEAVVRIPLSVALCHRYGVLGVVLAGVIGTVPTSLLIQSYRFIGIVEWDWRRAGSAAFVLLLKALPPVGLGFVVREVWGPRSLTDFLLFVVGYSGFAVAFYCYADLDVRQMASRGIKAVASSVGVHGKSDLW